MHNSTSKPKLVKYLFAAFLFFTLSATAQVQTPFTPRYSETINGDLTIIANNVLSDHPTNNFSGDEDNQWDHRVYVDIDSDGSTFNSSSANLANPEPGVTCLDYKKVFLYWSAANKEQGDGTFNADSWDYRNIKLMLPGSSSYTTMTADDVIFQGRSSHFYNDPYICVKDITDEISALPTPYGKYQAANIQASYGELQSHNAGDVGVSGGWQIVFVYESQELLRRNITLFDGYAHVVNNESTTFDVNGFLAVPNGQVKADIVLGAIEGDRVLDQDQLEILKPDGNWEAISTSLRDEDNFFNSSISRNGTHFLDRNPASTNTLGFDASIFELKNSGNKLIDNSQTSTSLRASSGNETYGLFLIGFSIEVYEPSLGALNFTTSVGGTTFNPGDTVPLEISVKNVGNDNIENLEISTILPPQVDFVDTDPLPPGVTFNFNAGTRELRFYVADGNTDVNDPLYTLNFNLIANASCTSCSTQVELQAVASFTGQTNTNSVSTLSSGTMDACGIGNHDPTYLTIIPNVSIDSATATEGSPVAFNIASSHLLPNDALFNISYTNISTTNGDYTATTSVTFPANSSSTTLNVPTLDDNIIEPTETFEAIISTTANVNVITATETGTIIDNDAVVGTGVSFSNTDIIVTEGTDTYAIFNVILTGNISENVTVDYTTNDGTALNTSDYNTETGTITFTPTNNSFNIQVPITDDAIIEPTEDFTVVLSNVQSNLGLGFTDGNTTNNANGIIHDDDAITGTGISYDATDVTVNEDAGTATFTVRLTGNVAGGFTLDYASADGSAVAPGDYTAISGQLTFLGNDNESYDIVVPIIDDLFIEATEGYVVNLSNLSTTLIAINTPQANGGINDNDGGVGTGISFDSTDVTVNEDAGTATFTVRLTGNVAGGFTLDYASADGSAVAPGDYTAVSGQLTFLGNDNESYDIVVPIIDDLLIEATEGYVVNLSNLSTTLIAINTPQANGGINDNDGGVGTGISFDSTDVTVNEDAGTATFTVRLTGNVPGGFTLDYASADGSAVAPGDYTAVSGQLTFLGNDNESYDIVVPIIDDLLIEATEGYVVNLSNLSTTLIAINTPQANGGINDNDGGSGTGISFDNTDVIVNEDAGTATFTVRLTGNVPGGFTLDYASADGSAVAPGDYTAVSGQLTFLGNDNESYDIVVPIIDDLLIEATEGYVVNLSNLSTALININTPQANGGIIDNDGGAGTGISFDSTDVIVNEDAGTATFTVRLTGNVPGGFTLDYASADGSAVNPDDYYAVSGQLTFAGNDNESYDIIVPIIDDLFIEATEGYVVNLSNLSTTLISINTPQANGGINDNDGGTGTGIDFDATDVTVNEDAGTATFTVRLTGNVPGGFTLDYTTADGSAVAPGDYTVVSGQLTFLGNDNESYDIVVPIVDDLLIEATEGYVVNLFNLSTALININTPQANGGIIDNDGGAGTGISFDSTDVVVDEDAGTATFTVRLTGNVPGGFTLDYASADGSAVNPDDYSAVSGQLTFLGNDNESYDIIVPIIDDLFIEATEGYVVNLSNLSTTLIAINTPQANGGINDNDGGTGTGISFDSTDVTVNEDAGTATFNVRFVGSFPVPFTVEFNSTDGTATNGLDYTSTSNVLTFSGLNNEVLPITITIIDDNDIEPTEDYNVNLFNISAGLININTPQANGGIIDNDGGAGTGIAFDNTDVIVNEDAGTATFTVRLTGNVPGGFTLDYASADGSAVAPDDYSAISGQLTFAGNDNESYDIVVPIVDDLLIEATEGYVVNLSNLSTTLIAINTPQANGGINDNDGGAGTGIAFDNTDVTVNEDAGTATFTVRLTGNVPGGFTLDYASADGSAVAPDDYSAVSGQLTFLGNDNESYDIVVPIIDDLFIEATEGYVVNLSNLSTTLIAINTPQANGGIIDNDGVAGTGIAFDNTDVIVNEDAGTATFTVRLTGNVPGGFTLDYASADGSAVAPDDYSAVSGQLTFAGNDNEFYDIVVPIVDDLFIEATEGYAVNLSNLSTALININTSQANGGINDNDDMPGIDGISFVQTEITVTEGNPSDTVVATFEVRLTGNYQDEFEVSFETAFGTATATDFEAQTGVLAFDGTDGQVETITVTILNDLIIESSESYTVLLTGVSNPVVPINTPEANGTILDDDMRMITSSQFEAEYMILCGEEIPEIPELTFSGGCGDYQVEFTEVEESSDTSDDYMIIRTWNVTDACGNMASFEQVIMVMQLEEALITIDICVEDEPIDLTTYLPENFDTNGTFTVTQGVALLDGNFFDPTNLELGEYIIGYSSTVGSCTYLAEYTINVNADCVECSEEDVIVSTAITPNGDGFNDVFAIAGAENCFFTFDVMIFNRWGNKVFEEQDYQNDWGGISPDGSFGSNGNLPSGTYYYIINISNRLDLKPINGYIYLGTK